MRLNDAVLGALLLVFAAGLALASRGFPSVPGQDYGASAFPTLIALGFALCGIVLVVSGLKARMPVVVWTDWARDRTGRVNVLATIAAVVFYILAADWLGFIPAMTLILVALLRRFGVGWAATIVVAILTPLLMQYLFGSLLLVPLPWGVLAPIRWW